MKSSHNHSVTLALSTSPPACKVKGSVSDPKGQVFYDLVTMWTCKREQESKQTKQIQRLTQQSWLTRATGRQDNDSCREGQYQGNGQPPAGQPHECRKITWYFLQDFQVTFTSFSSAGLNKVFQEHIVETILTLIFQLSYYGH